MVSGRFVRFDIDFEIEPQDFCVPGFVERQYDATDFAPLFAGDLTILTCICAHLTRNMR